MRVYAPQSEDLIVKSLTERYEAAAGYEPSTQSYRRLLHWDINDAARNLPWVRGSIVTVGKNLVGPKWTFAKVPEFEDEATEDALTELKRFYGLGAVKTYRNFKDYYTTSGKLYATAVSLALSNHAAWEIKSDALLGAPAGFDYIPGYVQPNVKADGSFDNPAFIQYLDASGIHTAEWSDPDQIVFFARPDFGGLPFASDLEALVQYTLPSEIYSALSWLAMHKNRNAPLDGFWVADPMMSDEDFEKLEALLRNRYTGARNHGRSPILAKGDLDFKRIQRAPDEAPYLMGRNYARQEIASVTGVPGSKLGVTEEMTRAGSREAKRDYYETTMEPLQQLIEEATYEQIHVRLFGIRGWTLKFNNPQFVNEIEQASIDRTYWNIGKVSANELRIRDGEKPREGGDDFFVPTNMIDENDPLNEDPGQNPDPLPPDESNPAGQKPRPVRADEQALVAELHRWRRMSLKRAKENRPQKPFESTVLPRAAVETVQAAIAVANGNADLLRQIFDALEAKIKGAQ